MINSLNDNSCNSSCHQLYKAGSPTHYYSWSSDPNESAKQTWKNIFQNFNLKKQDDHFAISFKNDINPHPMAQCLELIVVLTESNGEELIKVDTLRINRKAYHDSMVLGQFYPDNVVPGMNGTPYPSKGSTLMFPFTMRDESHEVKYDAYLKYQYWLSDFLGHKIHSDTLRIDN